MALAGSVSIHNFGANTKLFVGGPLADIVRFTNLPTYLLTPCPPAGSLQCAGRQTLSYIFCFMG